MSVSGQCRFPPDPGQAHIPPTWPKVSGSVAADAAIQQVVGVAQQPLADQSARPAQHGGPAHVPSPLAAVTPTCRVVTPRSGFAPLPLSPGPRRLPHTRIRAVLGGPSPPVEQAPAVGRKVPAFHSPFTPGYCPRFLPPRSRLRDSPCLAGHRRRGTPLALFHRPACGHALAFLVRAMETHVISVPTVPKVLAEWRTPRCDSRQKMSRPGHPSRCGSSSGAQNSSARCSSITRSVRSGSGTSRGPPRASRRRHSAPGHPPLADCVVTYLARHVQCKEVATESRTAEK